MRGKKLFLSKSLRVRQRSKVRVVGFRDGQVRRDVLYVEDNRGITGREVLTLKIAFEVYRQGLPEPIGINI